MACVEVQAGPDGNDFRGTWAFAPGITIFGGHPINNGLDNFSQCTSVPNMRMNCTTAGNNDFTHSAKSYHPGGVLSVFADGSTRFLNNTIDQTLYVYLRAIADGNPIASF